jgi:hypothetical protein
MVCSPWRSFPRGSRRGRSEPASALHRPCRRWRSAYLGNAVAAAGNLGDAGVLDSRHAEPPDIASQLAPADQVPTAVCGAEHDRLDVAGRPVVITREVADAHDALPGHAFFECRPDRANRTRWCVHPNAAREFVGPRSGSGVEDVQDLLDAGRGQVGVGGIRGCRYGREQRHRLRGGQADGREVRPGGQAVSAARPWAGPDRRAAVLQRGEISLDRPHRHTEFRRQSLSGAATRLPDAEPSR